MRIKRKVFEFSWTGVHGRSLVELQEKSKKIVSRGFLSKDCVVWLAGVLRKIASVCGAEASQAEEITGPTLIDGGRWIDYHGTLQVLVCQNGNDNFARIELSAGKNGVDGGLWP